MHHILDHDKLWISRNLLKNLNIEIRFKALPLNWYT
jgi:hypothetical protein